VYKRPSSAPDLLQWLRSLTRARRGAIFAGRRRRARTDSDHVPAETRARLPLQSMPLGLSTISRRPPIPTLPVRGVLFSPA